MLQRIAESGRSALRRGDLFGRIGGEEFAAVFPGCAPDMAMQIAERLQREIQRQNFQSGGTTFSITASQGLTNLGPEDSSLKPSTAAPTPPCIRPSARARNQIVLV